MRYLISTPDAVTVVEAQGSIWTMSVGDVRVDELKPDDRVPATEFGSREWDNFWEKLNKRRVSA